MRGHPPAPAGREADPNPFRGRRPRRPPGREREKPSQEFATSHTDQLLRRCTEGDGRAWLELVDRYRPAILRVMAKAASPTTVEDLRDLEQEVWTRLLHRDQQPLRRLRRPTEATLRAFLCTVALNVARDARRRAGRRPQLEVTQEGELADWPDGTDLETLLADRQRHRQALEAARAEVGDEERDLLIFELYFRDGATASEIAAFPGIDLSVKGVETVLFRLTRKVRQRLGTGA